MMLYGLVECNLAYDLSSGVDIGSRTHLVLEPRNSGRSSGPSRLGHNDGSS